MTSMQIGVDLAKSVFEVAVSTVPGRVHERRRLSYQYTRPGGSPVCGALNSKERWQHQARLITAGKAAGGSCQENVGIGRMDDDGADRRPSECGGVDE